MKATDLSGLIKGLMVVIGIAMALGRLDDLKRWAAQEAFASPVHHKQDRCPNVHSGLFPRTSTLYGPGAQQKNTTA